MKTMTGNCNCEGINWISTEKMFDMHLITICPDCEVAVIWNY